MSGKAQLISTSSVIGEADMVDMYNEARDDEYEEILDKCADFHAGVEKEVAAEHFTYGELEENEEDLAKLKACRADLEAFAASVYEAADHGSADSS
jgi:hypothetical protein